MYRNKDFSAFQSLPTKKCEKIPPPTTHTKKLEKIHLPLYCLHTTLPLSKKKRIFSAKNSLGTSLPELCPKKKKLNLKVSKNDKITDK